MDRNPAAPFDGKTFGTEMVEVVKTYFERQFTPFMARLEALEQQIKSIPAARDGRDADTDAVASVVVSKLMPEIDSLRATVESIDTVTPDIVKSLVNEALATLPAPKDGAPGEPGKSLEPADIAPLIEAAVEKRVAAIEIKDGRDGLGMAGAMIDREGQLLITMTDGSVKTLGAVVGADGKSVGPEDIVPLIKTEVAAAVAALPPAPAGKDGTSVTEEQVIPVLVAKMEAEICDRFSRLPVPKDGADGKSVDIEEIKPVLKALVDDEVIPFIESRLETEISAIPVPENGKDGTSVTLDDVAPIIEKAVAEKVAAIPVPENGKSVDPADVESMVIRSVAAVVNALPPAAPGRDGTSVTVADVEPIIVAEVKRLVADFPVPADGKSVTVDELAPLVVSEVEKAVSKIPVPKDGVGVAGALIDRSGELVVTLSDGSAKALGPVVGRDGRDGKNGEPPDLSALDDIAALPDDLNKRIAKAVRLMAETPSIVASAAAGAPVQKSESPVHIHMPEMKLPELQLVVPKMEPTPITVKLEQPPKRATRTIVEEHDARGRVKKFRQEEID